MPAFWDGAEIMRAERGKGCFLPRRKARGRGFVRSFLLEGKYDKIGDKKQIEIIGTDPNLYAKS